jgi:hypothetical protein
VRQYSMSNPFALSSAGADVIVYSSGIDRGDEIDMPKSGWRRAVPGAVLAAVAVLAFVSMRGLSYGTAAHIGPGVVPAILGALLFILGLAITAEGFWQRSIGGEQ